MTSQSSSQQAKIGILVVHGVGNPDKGGTLSELVRGLASLPGPANNNAPIETTDHKLIVTTATEQEPDSVYEAPAKRFTIGQTDYLATELFWGDLSQIKPGFFNLLRGLFDLLYGLPGIIRHMLNEARSTYPHAAFAWYRLILLFSATVITGPILALTLMGLTGIFSSFVVYQSKTALLKQCTITECLSYDATIFLMSFLVLALAAGRLRQWFKQQQWSRLTLIYLFYFSIAASIFMLIAIPGWLSPYTLFNVLPLSIVLVWILAALVNGIAVVLLLWIWSTSDRNTNNGLTASFILTELSFCLWALVTAGLFYALFKVLPDNYYNEYLAAICRNCDVFSIGDSTGNPDIKIPLDVAPLLMLPFIALTMTVALFFHTRLASRRDNPARLILPDTLFPWMLVFAVAAVLTMLYAGWSLIMSHGTDSLKPSGFINHVSMGLMIAMITLMVLFYRQIHHGLDIGLDVANYWRAERIGVLAEYLPPILRSFETSTKQPMTRVVNRLNRTDRMLARWRVFSGPKPASRKDTVLPDGQRPQPQTFGTDITSFYKRFQMRVRFVATFKAIMADKPDHLLIISHSQGTMIAIDGLQHLKSHLIDSSLTHERLVADKIQLVTMGSPYQHLYGHYFPQTHQPDPFAQNGPYQSWLNLYRRNDYIGQRISGPTDIVNEDVGPRGHTGYWHDSEVLQRLQTHLRSNGIHLS